MRAMFWLMSVSKRDIEIHVEARVCDGVQHLCRPHPPGPTLRECVMGSPGSLGSQKYHELEVSNTWAFRGTQAPLASPRVYACLETAVLDQSGHEFAY